MQSFQSGSRCATFKIIWSVVTASLKVNGSVRCQISEMLSVFYCGVDFLSKGQQYGGPEGSIQENNGATKHHKSDTYIYRYKDVHVIYLNFSRESKLDKKNHQRNSNWSCRPWMHRPSLPVSQCLALKILSQESKLPLLLLLQVFHSKKPFWVSDSRQEAVKSCLSPEWWKHFRSLCLGSEAVETPWSVSHFLPHWRKESCSFVVIR